MSANRAPRPSQARSIGYRAAALLRPNYRGSVVAVGSRAVYMRGDDGEFLWLGGPTTPLHARAVVVDVLPASLSPGAVAYRRGDAIICGDSTAVVLTGAVAWTAPPVAPCGASPAALFAVRLAALDRLLAPITDDADTGALSFPIVACSQGTVGDFGSAQESPQPPIPGELDPGTGPCSPSPTIEGRGAARREVSDPEADVRPAQRSAASALDAAFTARSRPLLEEAAVTLARGNVAALPQLARGLAGLGPGLTPSGDDMLGGLMFALRLLALLYPGQLAWTPADGEGLAARLRAATHPLSHTILADLARGDAPEPLHRLACELFDAGGDGPRPETVVAIRAIGSRSGTDLLTGFRTGLFAAESLAGWTGRPSSPPHLAASGAHDG